MNEKLIYISKKPEKKFFSNAYWNLADIDEIVNQIFGEPKAKVRESYKDVYIYSESTKPSVYKDKFIMNCF